jgi:hypothetical protein
VSLQCAPHTVSRGPQFDVLSIDASASMPLSECVAGWPHATTNALAQSAASR